MVTITLKIEELHSYSSHFVVLMQALSKGSHIRKALLLMRTLDTALAPLKLQQQRIGELFQRGVLPTSEVDGLSYRALISYVESKLKVMPDDGDTLHEIIKYAKSIIEELAMELPIEVEPLELTDDDLDSLNVTALTIYGCGPFVRG